MTSHPPSDRTAWERELQLRFTDIDPLGHVTAAMYLVLFEEGRSAWMAEVLEEPCPIYVVATQTTDYVRELMIEDGPVRVQVSLARLGRSSVTLSETLLAGSGELRARSTVTLIMWDLEQRIARPLTENERLRLEPHLADAPPGVRAVRPLDRR